MDALSLMQNCFAAPPAKLRPMKSFTVWLLGFSSGGHLADRVLDDVAKGYPKPGAGEYSINERVLPSLPCLSLASQPEAI